MTGGTGGTSAAPVAAAAPVTEQGGGGGGAAGVGIRFQISSSRANSSHRTSQETKKRRGHHAGSDLNFGHDDDDGIESSRNDSAADRSSSNGGRGGGDDATRRREATSFSKDDEESAHNSLPVIPVKPNTRLHPTSDRGEAVKRPEDVVSSGSQIQPSQTVSSASVVVIPSRSTLDVANDKETEQYKKQVEDLPDEPTLDDYQRSESAIPISQFGAALLRGMGWKGDTDDNKKKGEEGEVMMPRPHRLGLGAIPKEATAAVTDVPVRDKGGSSSATTTSSKPRRPDQVRQDERLRRQLAEFAAQKKERVALDKQAVLQDGSVVYLDGRTVRARVVQLVGVPGLNKVRVSLERDHPDDDGHNDDDERSHQEVIVNRRDLGELVSRSELASRPFVEAAAPPSKELADNERNKRKRERDYDHDASNRNETSRRRDATSRRSDREESSDASDDGSYRERDSRRRDKKRRKESKRDRPDREPRPRDDDRNGRRDDRKGSTRSAPASGREEDAWLVPHIRVRVATTKYGQRHFQQKGVVVDVTPRGATVQMDDAGKHALLDRVPARHLTTALPKVGGCAVVVQGEHKRAMGTILQRDSRVAVLQLHEDHSVLPLSLDDLAEWCGPRMDE